MHRADVFDDNCSGRGPVRLPELVAMVANAEGTVRSGEEERTVGIRQLLPKGVTVVRGDVLDQ